MKITSYSYTDLKNLKLNDIIYECSRGINLKMEVSVIPVQTYSVNLKANQLEWYCIMEDGNTQKYFITEGLSHYGPTIYDYPAYAEINLVNLIK